MSPINPYLRDKTWNPWNLSVESTKPIEKGYPSVEEEVDQELPPHSLPQAGPPSEHKYYYKRKGRVSWIQTQILYGKVNKFGPEQDRKGPVTNLSHDAMFANVVPW